MSHFSTFCFCVKLLFLLAGIAFFIFQALLVMAFQLLVTAFRLFSWGWSMSSRMRGSSGLFSSIVSSVTNRINSISEVHHYQGPPHLTTEQQQLQEAIRRSLLDNPQAHGNHQHSVRHRQVTGSQEVFSQHSTMHAAPSGSTTSQECPYPTESTNCLHMPQPLIHPDILYIRQISSPHPSAPYIDEIQQEHEYYQPPVSELFNVD